VFCAGHYRRLALGVELSINIYFMNDRSKQNEKDYHISFFRPTTKLATFNRNMSIILVTVWAVCIFGFQIVLRIMEEPVPETAYVAFESVWDQVQSEQATMAEKQVFVKSALSVLGKVTLDPKDRGVLNAAVGKLTLEMVPLEQQNDFNQQITDFKASEFGDENYIGLKTALSNSAAKVINVQPYSLEAKLIPLELVAATTYQLQPHMVEAVMAKYLIHNQSVLTDTIFLGFPFHYFYTGVFLMILFVGICLYYCVATDRAMKRLGVAEE
jgi:hypothetical protein